MLIHPSDNGKSSIRPLPAPVMIPPPTPPPAPNHLLPTLDLVACHLGLLVAKARRFADIDLEVDRLYWDLATLACTCPSARRVLHLVAGGLGNAYETLDPERIARRLRALEGELGIPRPPR
jgi:hypothetical protein